MSAAGTLARPADGQTGAWDSDTRAALEALAQTQPQVQAMLDQPGRWPAEVAALLARNAEALDFVPVSYTHLDVYKRQLLTSALRRSLSSMMTSSWSSRFALSSPVRSRTVSA